MRELISVIIPAFNATPTLTETVQSALRQSYPHIEVIVVDDGSTDGTIELAQKLASTDPRVRIIARSNEGVARARNHGIEAARGAFIAPLDADDLWHPEKLALQLERFAVGPPSLGLVYNWFRRIDTSGRVVELPAAPVVEGWVVHRHLDWNFVSNGSTPLIRRRALGDLRYDPTLQAANAQGCEDYLLQLQIAFDHQFACVPAYLTGYRRTAGAMSTDVGRMIRSHLEMYRVVWPRLGPTARRVARRRMAGFHAEYSRNRLRRGQLAETLRAVGQAFACDPLGAPIRLGEQARLTLTYLQRRRRGSPATSVAGCHFDDHEITERDVPAESEQRLARFRKLAVLDEAYGRATVSS